MTREMADGESGSKKPAQFVASPYLAMGEDGAPMAMDTVQGGIYHGSVGFLPQSSPRSLWRQTCCWAILNALALVVVLAMLVWVFARGADPHRIVLRVLEFIVLVAVVLHLVFVSCACCRRHSQVPGRRRFGFGLGRKPSFDFDFGVQGAQAWRNQPMALCSVRSPCAQSLNIMLSIAYAAVLGYDLGPDRSADSAACCSSSGHVTLATLAVRTLTYSLWAVYEAVHSLRVQGGLGMALGVSRRDTWDVSDLNNINELNATFTSFGGDSSEDWVGGTADDIDRAQRYSVLQ